MHKRTMVTTRAKRETGKAWAKKSSKERPLRAAIRIPTGLPKTVEADPMFVARTDEMTKGIGEISNK